MGFLMTTESQDLSLTSHPKDGIDKHRQIFFSNERDYHRTH